MAFSHEMIVADMTSNEIIKQRQGNMSKIKAFSTKMYPLTMSGEFDEIRNK